MSRQSCHATGAHSFAVQDVEGDFCAAAFQHAIDSNDADRFDALLCFLAGGKPVMLEDLSAASFCVGDTVETHAIDEYLGCCQPADTRFGVCAVGGAMNVNNFQVHDKILDGALVVPPPPAPPAAPQSAVSDEGMYLVSALHAHEPDTSFMDTFAVRLELTNPDPPLAMHCMGPVAPVDSVSVTGEESEDDDEAVGVLGDEKPDRDDILGKLLARLDKIEAFIETQRLGGGKRQPADSTAAYCQPVEECTPEEVHTLALCQVFRAAAEDGASAFAAAVELHGAPAVVGVGAAAGSVDISAYGFSTGASGASGDDDIDVHEELRGHRQQVGSDCAFGWWWPACVRGTSAHSDGGVPWQD
ncbi:hypothetical protein CYMTET_40730 [Cymbomonas tetramitiformis]|uniref:Uncharacterized protein n=1 Tax=Cymbomonas tetramitiformis TaxID=36881 RepID=A0AAE0F3C4_9CHLO|nr:hypothetical protein CYMTET_40730 [Cymbomonas tetramitiformis]